MLSSDYNTLTLKGLEPSGTYFDKLPKDLVWYMLGYTGPQNGYLVLKAKYSFYGGTRDHEIVKATTLASREKLRQLYPENAGVNIYHQTVRHEIVPVKFVFIDGKQYAAIPVKKKIEGFTPPKNAGDASKDAKRWRCTGYNKSGKRCRKKTKNATEMCSVHRKKND